MKNQEIKKQMKQQKNYNPKSFPKMLIKYSRWESQLKKDKKKLEIFAKDFEKCMKDIIQRFTFSQIANEHKEVIGHIEEYYGEWTPYIYQQGLLEKACNEIKKSYVPEIIKVVPKKYLQLCHEIPVNLLSEFSLKGYPLQKFDRAIIYSPKEELVEALYIDPQKELEIEGFYLEGVLAKGSMILLGFPQPNLPAFMLAYSPKLAEPFTAIFHHVENLDLEEIDEEAAKKLKNDEIIKTYTDETAIKFKEYYGKAMNQTITQVKNNNMIIDRNNRSIVNLEENYEDLEAENVILSSQRSRFKMDGEKDPNVITVNKITGIIIACLAILGVFFIAFLLFGNNFSTPNEEAPTNLGFLYRSVKLCRQINLLKT